MVTASLSRRGGGVFEAVRGLAAGLQASGAVYVSAVGLADEMTAEDAAAWEGIPTTACPVRGPAALGYAPQLANVLREVNPDLIHLQGLWTYTSVAVAAWSHRTGRPAVITPQGMLEPWAVQNSRWKKRIAGAVYEDRNLRRAACLHALSDKEVHDIRVYGLRNPICVIPNGVDLPSKAGKVSAPWNGAVPGNAKVLLYLGRLHPKKNLEALIQGWASALRSTGCKDWWLVIAGWDQGGYERRLRQLVYEQQLARVCFAGPQFGEAKDASFRHANAFVLPSLSEGLPVVVLEAWSYGLPVLMTPECNLSNGFETGAAIQIGTDPQAICAGLAALFDQDNSGREEMGSRGRTLVERQYTWPRVAEQMRAVYRWVLGEDPPPTSLSEEASGNESE